MHIIYHLHPQDGMQILVFPTEDLYAWMNRLTWVFDPVVLGTTGYGEPLFDDDLAPPSGP